MTQTLFRVESSLLAYVEFSGQSGTSLVRPIYMGMGIIPEIAKGLEAGAEAAQPPKS